MALELKLTNEVANAECDAACSLANNGYLRIYDGSKPATADTAVSGQVLLAELRLNATAFAAAVAGAAAANAITKEDAALASGTPTWYRVLKSNGTTPLWDGTVGTASANLVLAAATIAAGQEVTITALTHTVPKG